RRRPAGGQRGRLADGPGHDVPAQSTIPDAPGATTTGPPAAVPAMTRTRTGRSEETRTQALPRGASAARSSIPRGAAAAHPWKRGGEASVIAAAAAVGGGSLKVPTPCWASGPTRARTLPPPAGVAPSRTNSSSVSPGSAPPAAGGAPAAAVES